MVDDGDIFANGTGKVDENGCCVVPAVLSNEVDCLVEVFEEDKKHETDLDDERRPPKKTKCLMDETCSVQHNNGQIQEEEDVDKSCEHNERQTIMEHTLRGQASEWALLRRHSSEGFFSVQICGAYPDTVAKTVELIEKHCTLDFIDINIGCPINIVVNKNAGSALLTKPMRMKSVVEASSRAVDTPVTIKVRMGYFEGKNRTDSLIHDIGNWGAAAITIHGSHKASTVQQTCRLAIHLPMWTSSPSQSASSWKW